MRFCEKYKLSPKKNPKPIKQIWEARTKWQKHSKACSFVCESIWCTGSKCTKEKHKHTKLCKRNSCERKNFVLTIKPSNKMFFFVASVVSKTLPQFRWASQQLRRFVNEEHRLPDTALLQCVLLSFRRALFPFRAQSMRPDSFWLQCVEKRWPVKSFFLIYCITNCWCIFV